MRYGKRHNISLRRWFFPWKRSFLVPWIQSRVSGYAGGFITVQQSWLSETIPLPSVMTKAEVTLLCSCVWGTLVHWCTTLTAVHSLKRLFKVINLIMVYQDYNSLCFNLGVKLLPVQGANENTVLVLLNRESPDIPAFLGILHYLSWQGFFCLFLFFPKPQPLDPQEGASF